MTASTSAAVAVVTGGNRGIGYAISAELLKDHATLDRYIGLRVAEGKPTQR